MNRLIFIIFTFFIFLKSDCSERELPVRKIEDEIKHEDFSDKDTEEILYICVGIDYIPQEIVKIFTRISGIKVVVDIFDSNEMLEAKILAGGAQYDVVFPTAFPCFDRQLRANVYNKLDKKKINLSVFDSDILDKLALFDKNNEYCIPFQWGISGIGINEKIVKELLGNDVEINSYSIIFDPINTRKLSKRGISIYEAHEELFPTVAAYLGQNPEYSSYENVREIVRHLKKIRNFVSKFTNYGFEDLLSGSSCVALGTSGDIKNVQRQQVDSTGFSDIKFIFPKEGASLWVDVAAIPVTATHIKNAHLFLKFLMHPIITAEITNQTYRANAILNSKKYIIPEILNDEFIFPTNDIKNKCYIERYQHGDINRMKTRALTNVKSNI